MAHNQFETLRHPGIVGQVAYHGFDFLPIWSRGQSQKVPEQSVSIITAQIDHGKWAFGFQILSGKHDDKALPGEIPGWFSTKEHALLYGLEFIRTHPYCPEEAKFNITQHIYKMRNPSLF